MPEAQRSAVLLARVALVAGLLASAYGGWQVHERIQREATTQFAFAADQVTLRINERLRAYELVLRGGAGLFIGSDEVTRDDWRRFVGELGASELVPAVQGIGYAVAIPAGELAAHEAGVRAQGFPDYRVWPEEPRDEHTAIVFLEPFRDRNLRAFGYDMYSEPVRRQAMARARDTGEAALSGKVVLVQESEGEVQAGTLMYVPVYRRDQPADTPEQRRQALLGWVYSPYRMNDVMTGLVRDWQTTEGRYLHLRIFDGAAPDPDRLLFDSGNANANAGGMGGRDEVLSARRKLDFHGHTWLLDFNRRDDAPPVSYLPAWLAAAAGVALSGLMFGLLMSLALTRERGLRLAHTLTEAIQRRERQLEESEFRWRFALEGNGDGIWDWNMVDDTIWHSEQYRKMLDFGPDQAGEGLGHWKDRIHPEDRERALAALEDYLHGRSGQYSSEHRQRRKDGHYLWVLDRGLVVERSENGSPLRMIGTQSDITARKEADALSLRYRAELEEAQRIARFASWTVEKASGRVTWTPQLFEMFGLPATPDGEAPSFEAQRQHFPPDTYQGLAVAMGRMLEDGQPSEMEAEMIRADGSRGWALVRGEAVRSPGGHVSAIHGVVADITERKLAQIRIEQLNRLYAALSECNWAIIHCTNEIELLERVCDVLVRHGGIDTAWVGMVNVATGAVTPAYARGQGAAAIEEVPVSVDPGEPAGRGPTGMAVREHRPVWIDDFAQNPLTSDWRPVAARFGWRAAAYLPLLHRRNPFAVLTLYSTQAGWADSDTRALIEQIASNVNFALDKLGVETDAKAFRQRQLDAEQRFRALVDSSRVGAFIVQEGIIRYANQSAGEILGVPGPGKLIGLQLTEIAEPAHREVIGRALSDLAQERTRTLDTIISAARPDGTRIDIRVKAALASEGDKAPILGLIEEAGRGGASGGSTQP